MIHVVPIPRISAKKVRDVKFQQLWLIYLERLKGSIRRMERRIYGNYQMYRFDLTKMQLPSSELKHSFMLIPMNKESCREMIRANEEEISESQQIRLMNRLKSGSPEKAYILKDSAGETLGYYCAAYGVQLAFNKSRYVSMPENVYLFDDYTFERHRNKGAHQSAILARMRIAGKIGYQSATAMIASDNTYSIKAYQKCGFSKNEDAVYIRPFTQKTEKPSV
jgi:hypothetical protein